jgi:hypothetical protein
MLACARPCWVVVRRLVGFSSAKRTPASQLPAGVIVRVFGSSRMDYFTLNVSHFVVAAACAAVLAIVACRR